MIHSSMSWDPALLRKFSSTGHFRLLNQVRSELSSQPLERDPKTRALMLKARPHRGQPVRQQRRPNAIPEGHDTFADEAGSTQASPKSFRERLNAIEMR
jgi:hypothetical protein|tara:strand:+ start:90 stop:386 length:297 start_codon:yes stop_codon:yes gene_type:complete